MNTQWKTQLSLALYAVLGMAAITGMALLVFSPGVTDWALAVLGQGTLPAIVRITIGVLLVLLMGWSMWTLMLAVRRGGPHAQKTHSVAVQNTENGVVRVSVGAIDTLVRQAIQETDGVTNVKTQVINHEDSVSVRIEMKLAEGAHIPNVTFTMQRNVKSYIEEFSGIAVREVLILITEMVPREQRLLTDGSARPENVRFADPVIDVTPAEDEVLEEAETPPQAFEAQMEDESEDQPDVQTEDQSEPDETIEDNTAQECEHAEESAE